MDPNATVSMMLAAIASGKMAEACEHACNLLEWTNNGGFAPDPINPIELAEAVFAHENVT